MDPRKFANDASKSSQVNVVRMSPVSDGTNCVSKFVVGLDLVSETCSPYACEEKSASDSSACNNPEQMQHSDEDRSRYGRLRRRSTRYAERNSSPDRSKLLSPNTQSPKLHSEQKSDVKVINRTRNTELQPHLSPRKLQLTKCQPDVPETDDVVDNVNTQERDSAADSSQTVIHLYKGSKRPAFLDEGLCFSMKSKALPPDLKISYGNKNCLKSSFKSNLVIERLACDTTTVARSGSSTSNAVSDIDMIADDRIPGRRATKGFRHKRRLSRPPLKYLHMNSTSHEEVDRASLYGKRRSVLQLSRKSPSRLTFFNSAKGSNRFGIQEERVTSVGKEEVSVPSDNASRVLDVPADRVEKTDNYNSCWQKDKSFTSDNHSVVMMNSAEKILLQNGDKGLKTPLSFPSSSRARSRYTALDVPVLKPLEGWTQLMESNGYKYINSRSPRNNRDVPNKKLLQGEEEIQDGAHSSGQECSTPLTDETLFETENRMRLSFSDIPSGDCVLDACTRVVIAPAEELLDEKYPIFKTSNRVVDVSGEGLIQKRTDDVTTKTKSLRGRRVPEDSKSQENHSLSTSGLHPSPFQLLQDEECGKSVDDCIPTKCVSNSSSEDHCSATPLQDDEINENICRDVDDVFPVDCCRHEKDKGNHTSIRILREGLAAPLIGRSMCDISGPEIIDKVDNMKQDVACSSPCSITPPREDASFENGNPLSTQVLSSTQRYNKCDGGALDIENNGTIQCDFASFSRASTSSESSEEQNPNLSLSPSGGIGRNFHRGTMSKEEVENRICEYYMSLNNSRENLEKDRSVTPVSPENSDSYNTVDTERKKCLAEGIPTSDAGALTLEDKGDVNCKYTPSSSARVDGCEPEDSEVEPHCRSYRDNKRVSWEYGTNALIPTPARRDYRLKCDISGGGEVFPVQETGSKNDAQVNDEAVEVLTISGYNVPMLYSHGTIYDCVKTLCERCVYCYHAKRIAVNGKQLILHLIDEHRFDPLFYCDRNEVTSIDDLTEKLNIAASELQNVYMFANFDNSKDENVLQSGYECLRCPKTFNVHTEFCVHNRKLHQKTILCIMCKTVFGSYCELLCHLCPGIYVPQGSVSYRCCLCVIDKELSAFRLTVHIRKRHNTCDICLQSSCDQHNLSNHIRIHKVNHVCRHCRIAYRNKSDMKKHMFWKHGTESVFCKKCLQKRWSHVYHFCIPPKTFYCEKCDANFSRAVALKVHNRMHDGCMPYACKECNEKFICRKLLGKHLHQHVVQNVDGRKEISDQHSNELTLEDDTVVEIAKDVDDTVSKTVLENDTKAEGGVETCSLENRGEFNQFSFAGIPPLNLSSDSEGSDVPTQPNKEQQRSDINVPRILEQTIRIGSLSQAIDVNIINDENHNVWDDSRKYNLSLDKVTPGEMNHLDCLPPHINTDHDYCQIAEENRNGAVQPLLGTIKLVPNAVVASSTCKPCKIEKINSDPVAECSSTKKKRKKRNAGQRLHTLSSSSSGSESSGEVSSNKTSSSCSSSSCDSSDDSESVSSRSRRGREHVIRARDQSEGSDGTVQKEDEISTPVEDDCPEEEESLLRESDLDTEESETEGEDFYEEHPEQCKVKINTRKGEKSPLSTMDGPSSTETYDDVKSGKKQYDEGNDETSRSSRKRILGEAAEQCLETSSTVAPDAVYESDCDSEAENGRYTKRRKKSGVREPVKYSIQQMLPGLSRTSVLSRHDSAEAISTDVLKATDTPLASSCDDETSEEEPLTCPSRLNKPVETWDSSSDGETECRTNQDEVSRLYCYCQRPYDDESSMIGCDGKNCKLEWFHFECVSIVVPPKGKWFCPDCRKTFKVRKSEVKKDNSLTL